MAAKKTKPNTAPITAAQRKQILDLYVYGLAEAPEIAAELNLDVRAVRPALRPLLPIRRRLWGSPEVQAKTEERTKDMAERRGRMETKCAQLAEVRIDAQTDVACKLKVQAAQADKPEDVRSVARALGPASQDVTSGRLAVGLSTSKDETADEAVDEFCRAWVQAVAQGAGVAPPVGAVGDPAGVEPPAAPGAALVAGKAGG